MMADQTAADILAEVQDRLDGQRACLADTDSILEWAIKLLADVVGEQAYVVRQIRKAHKMNGIAMTLGSDIGAGLRRVMPLLIDANEATEGGDECEKCGGTGLVDIDRAMPVKCWVCQPERETK